MIFTLREIEDRISVFTESADQIDKSAEKYTVDPLVQRLKGCASGLREAAASLERMVQDCLADEAESYLL